MSEERPEASDVEQNKVMGIIAYLSILWIIPYFVRKDSKFALYHANQGALLTVVGLFVWLALAIIGLIPILNWILLLLWPALGLVWIALIALGITNAVAGHCHPLPVFGDTFTLIKPDGSLVTLKELQAGPKKKSEDEAQTDQ